MAEQRAQRRLAVILAADVVGYSRLMEQDEAGTLAALKRRRKEILEPSVGRHQGRIFKVTGDGVLVEFASAVNAVQCAIDLQHSMAVANAGEPEDRNIVLRIGLHLARIIHRNRRSWQETSMNREFRAHGHKRTLRRAAMGGNPWNPHGHWTSHQSVPEP
jgi:class 3 adenylate cyclase